MDQTAFIMHVIVTETKFDATCRKGFHTIYLKKREKY